ncbi:hypothetical protein KJ853_04305 [Patescibacteria group bacterium]|nr:hypothetical protein [Patescibacteria group bacterium]
MTRIIVLLMFVCFMAGCAVLPLIQAGGEISGGLRDATCKPSEKLNIVEPLKVDKNEAATIKKVAIYSLYDQIKDPEDKRMYLVALNIFLADLEQSKRFSEIITPTSFKKKQQELEIEFTPAMTQKEAEDAVVKVAKALGCDAVIYIYQKARKINMGSAFLKYGFTGRVDVPMTMILGVDSAKHGKVIWLQEQDYVFSAGGVGTKNMGADGLREMLLPIIKPLANNLVATF